jgi:curved DNA-binding protein
MPGHEPGDFYVILQIINPPINSETAKHLYQEMAAKLAFNPRADLEV